MKNIISTALNCWLKSPQKSVLLFDSIAAANEIAFMLKGDWDGCNGVIVSKCDEVAINTATNLMEATWCYQGAWVAVSQRLTTDELLRRYAIGERHFINANLRSAKLCSLVLSEVNLSRAKLNLANFSGTNLSQADLTAADIQDANLSDTNLSQSQLVRANLISANLSRANLRGANLSHACLSNANLSEADLRGANLSQVDLKGANLSGVLFDNC
ncbi:pentapeptide repeat-containing protein [Chlorogloeopsis sp. ULAP02]|uniref:pentapeptide repeat-containing protein n=1 Tax=Chlorogloeopsis sp. ULAP02 TaxID=3107926 RepID=UPI003134725E